MLKAQLFHAIAVDKLPKIHAQLNEFLATLGDDDVVSVNTTEVSFSGVQAFYSYTVLVVYKGSADSSEQGFPSLSSPNG